MTAHAGTGTVVAAHGRGRLDIPFFGWFFAPMVRIARKRSAVYAIDFHDLTDQMRGLYEGADVWVSDCLGRRPHPTHTHLDAVLGWAREMRVGKLYLSHMNNSMDYRTLVEELPDWAAPAHDGLEIELR